MTKASALFCIITTFGLFCGGCATVAGSKYEYNENEASPSVAVGESFGGPSSTGEADVNIYQIDGLAVGPLGWLFNFNHQGRFLDKAGKAWVSPGKHVLALTFDQSKPVAGSTGGTDVTGSGTIEAVFAASHTYAITATLGSQDRFEVTLWDETGGPTTRSSIAHWEFAGWRGTQ